MVLPSGIVGCPVGGGVGELVVGVLVGSTAGGGGCSSSSSLRQHVLTRSERDAGSITASQLILAPVAMTHASTQDEPEALIVVPDWQYASLVPLP